ncbi:hypothetical protein LHJ68_13260 [Staphylococcus xylosus]|uniref:hypothetical protein n=1 Tax=Staphylococcus xylosus TaxID=1288 RepID=UPI001F44FDBD|nr:hypothetical protein [Staphylococcus xylosus]MCE7786973.1 hypothetical protein [Staphylococcus xylosus]
MNKNYEITLHSRNGNDNGETFKDIHLNVYEHIHDIDIKSYSFSSSITNEKYSDEVNWCINYLLLEIYNGVRILCGFRPFIPHEHNTQLKTLNNHIEAYEIINSSYINIVQPNIRDNEFRRVMRVVMCSKNLRDLCILLDRVLKFDENSLINFYKIKDFVKSYKDLFKTYNGEYKDEIEELSNVCNKLNKYHRLVNSYLTIGLAARHGLENQVPTKNKFNQDEIEEMSIVAIQKVINISKREAKFNFDFLSRKDQLKKKK